MQLPVSAAIVTVTCSSVLLPLTWSTISSTSLPAPGAMAPRTPTLPFLLLSLLLPPLAASKPVSFSFPSFSLRNLTLLGAASLRSSSLSLLPPSSLALFPVPIQFLSTSTPASFATSFLFSTTTNTTSRLAFVLSANPLDIAKNRSWIAVTFDAPTNSIGLSGNVTAAAAGVDLRSGNAVSSWIDYEAGRHRLDVSTTYASLRPASPAYSAITDLSARFAEFMFVGFLASSANGSGGEGGYVIESWSFRTSGLPTVDPASRASHNVSDRVRSALPGSGVAGHWVGRRKKLVLGLGISFPVAVLGALMVLVVMSLKRAKGRTGLKVGYGIEVAGGPRQFPYQDLLLATKGFDPSLVVGSGGFGTVYKAVRPGSRVAYAVKRSKQSRDSYKEFTAELSIIAGLKHPNLVQLHGWCVERDELLLVYEFMSNGSLDEALHRCSLSGPSATLNWARRYNVAIGIAAVLAYLHQEHGKQVIHRDIKCSNILLDSEFNPRLGDFGLARLKEPDTSPQATLTAGTVGYLAPEYLQFGKATDKSDVYSYGVVLLEICTGRRPIDRETPESMNMSNVVDWVWNLHSEDKLLEAADPNLKREFDREQMMRLLLVGLSCVNPFSQERPVMGRVLDILEWKSEPVDVPRKKPLLVYVSNIPMDLDEIVSDCNRSAASSDMFELKIEIK